MKIMDWQCYFTVHQSHTWQAAQQYFDTEIIHVIAKISSQVRDEQGWSDVDLSEFSTIPLQRRGWWRQGRDLLTKHSDAVHVFGGFWADRRFFPLILYALWCGNKVVVTNESYATVPVGYMSNSSQWRNCLNVLLRPRLYQLVAWLVKKISDRGQFCLLALSSRAAEQFEQAGFRHEQVFPFGYFVPKLNNTTVGQNIVSKVVRIVFVGALLKRKGLDLAVLAIEELHREGLAVELHVFGCGDPVEYIRDNSACVIYKGKIEFGQAQSVIAEYDALILPSLHDGWGVVVNEALLQGVPVIVSSHVGAKCMIEHRGAGLEFKSGDLVALMRVMRKFVSDAQLRTKLKCEAGRLGVLIRPKYAAKYMKDVFEWYFRKQGARPDVLWKQ